MSPQRSGATSAFRQTGMLLEREARNTWENAVLSHRLVQPKPGETWLLVTSASHMPRAMGVFRQAGWDIIALAGELPHRQYRGGRGWMPPSRSGCGSSNGASANGSGCSPTG